MSLGTGTRLGSYEVLSVLGRGGMGEVWRARDVRLGRDVAIKALPTEFSDDADRLARFEREAKLLASLNHPNIASIYGVEQIDTRLFLVLELVEGETLADRLMRSRLPADEALEMAIQIADALDAAHHKGIIHRDLKPSNIKITPEGRVKVLDFGLAKAVTGEDAGSARSDSPTMSVAATQRGLLLGTAAYMSPEQAQGKAVDARSDIWAFGAVLYEMLAGAPAFAGETIVDILGAVLKSEPDWSALPPDVPPMIRALLRRCLQRDRNRRLHAVADARIEIEDALRDPNGVAPLVLATRRSRERWIWAGGVVAASAIALAIGTSLSRPSLPASEIRLQIQPTPPLQDPTQFALSPDGRLLVFRASNGLWLHPMNGEGAQQLTGTEGATRPFWSPDSRAIAFFAAGKLMRLDLAGGSARTIADVGVALGGTWNASGEILFAPSRIAPLSRVSDQGGPVTVATRLDPAHRSHRLPHFLPDGRHFLFYATGTHEVRGIYAGSLDSTESRRLFPSDTAAVFAPPKYVLYVREGTLFARELDLRRMQVVGEPAPIASNVAHLVGGQFATVALSASGTGLIAYQATTAPLNELRWVDRNGRLISRIGEPVRSVGGFQRIRLSPDEHTIAVSRNVAGNEDLWLIETARGTQRRLTSNPGRDIIPIWSPDGSRVAFSSFRNGTFDLYVKNVDEAGPSSVLLESLENKNAFDWSPDGRFIVHFREDSAAGVSLWVLPLEGSRSSMPVRRTSGATGARFSPDGRWLAFQSSDSGRYEVYIEPFPGPGRRIQVSTGGGGNAQWRGDSREIFYIDPSRELMSARIVEHPSGRVDVSRSSALFRLPSQGDYAPARDGKRFVVSEPLEEPALPPLTILLNWDRAKRQ